MLQKLVFRIPHLPPPSCPVVRTPDSVIVDVAPSVAPAAPAAPPKPPPAEPPAEAPPPQPPQPSQQLPPSQPDKPDKPPLVVETKRLPCTFERIVIQFYAFYAHVSCREQFCKRELVNSGQRLPDLTTPIADHSGDPDGVVASAVSLLRCLVGKTLDAIDAIEGFETRLLVCSCFLIAWKAQREDMLEFWLPSPYAYTNTWAYHCLFSGCEQVSATETIPKSLSVTLGEMQLRLVSLAQHRLYTCLFLHPLEILERRIDSLVAMDTSRANESEFGVRVVAGYVLVGLAVSAKTHDPELDAMLACGDAVIANVLLSIATSLLRMHGVVVQEEVRGFCERLDPGTLLVVHQALRCLCACEWLPPLEEGSPLGGIVKASRLKRLKTATKAELKKWFG